MFFLINDYEFKRSFIAIYSASADDHVFVAPERLQLRLRELQTPAHAKRILLSHVRQCRNPHCETCLQMREHLRKLTRTRYQAATMAASS